MSESDPIPPVPPKRRTRYAGKNPRRFAEKYKEFDPARFANVDTEERHRFAYVPFAVGPRHCIGEGLAMYEILVHLQRMARRFTFTRADDAPIELEAQVNLRPRSNLMMRVTTR